MPNYRWTKVWAVQTPMDNEVQAGETIEVGANGGASQQVVRSVTVMYNKQGEPYKTLLLKAVD